jgi:hypothetical protein
MGEKISRILNFFKRDKAKRETTVTSKLKPPNPDNIKVKKIKRSWIGRWVRNRRDRQNSKKIYGGTREAHPKHVLKPLREIRPRRVFYSAGGVK